MKKNLLIVAVLMLSLTASAQFPPYLMYTLVNGVVTPATGSGAVLPGGTPPSILCYGLNGSGQPAPCVFNGGSSGTINSGANFSFPIYGSAAGTTLSPSNITGDVTGNNINVPGTMVVGTDPGIDESVWGHGIAEVGKTSITTANDFGMISMLKINNSGGSTSYEKAALFGQCQFNDATTTASAHDCIGVQGYGSTLAGTTNGRVWGGNFNASIPAGYDGYAIGAEMDLTNNGTFQPNNNQTNSKAGLTVDSIGANGGTTGLVIAGSGGWQNGILITNIMSGGAAILIPNSTPIEGLNNANTAYQNLLYKDTSDNLELGDGVHEVVMSGNLAQFFPTGQVNLPLASAPLYIGSVAAMDNANNIYAKTLSQLIGTAIASASTIAPTTGIVHITGTTTINTITAFGVGVEGGTFTGCIQFIFDGLASFGTSGNILRAESPQVGQVVQECYDPGTSKWYSDTPNGPSCTGTAPNQACTAANFISSVAIGTQPYATTSTTMNTNLNANFVGGIALAGLCQTGGSGCPTIPVAPVSNAVTSATGGSGTGTVACATASCTNLRGSYTVAGGTFATGILLTLVWPTTTTAYVCNGSVLNNATGASIGYHSVATATGMTFNSLTAATGLNIDVDYSCQP